MPSVGRIAQLVGSGQPARRESGLSAHDMGNLVGGRFTLARGG